MKIEPVMYPIAGALAGSLASWLVKDGEPYKDTALGLVVGALVGFAVEMNRCPDGAL